MSNKKKNILVWIFTWAALLLVVLYSPLGSPDLYSSTDGFYTAAPNADLSGSNLGSGNPNFGAPQENNELNVPDYNSAEGTKLSSGNYNYVTSNSPSNSASSANSYAAPQSKSYNSAKGGSESNAGNGGSTFISNNSSKSSDASSAVSMNSGGVTTMSSDLTTPPTTKQAVNYGANQGGTDPGGDPTGPPLPITDGWIFLLLLAATYGFAKWKIFTNKLG